MLATEILRRIAAAIPLDEAQLAELIRNAGLADVLPAPAALVTDPSEPGHQPCDGPTLVALLDGLVMLRRGPREGGAPASVELSNNVVLKKLRIALNLHDKDMLAIYERAGVHMSRNQLGALFRAPGNKHFQACSDAQLICFLTGLQRHRNDHA